MARQIYQDKIVLAKAIRSNINAIQRRRGWMLPKKARFHEKELKALTEGRSVSATYI